MTKWDYRPHTAGTRRVTFQPKGVSFDGNSNVILSIFEKDGETITSPVSHIPQFILLSTEVKGYRSPAHAP